MVYEVRWVGVDIIRVKSSLACFGVEERFCWCVVLDIGVCFFFICGFYFNLFLIVCLIYLVIKVKWFFDKCENFLISVNCFC